MTQPQKERITVTAIVEKKGQGKSGNEASVTIGAFESKYPTLLNKIPDADFALLVPGQTVTIIIERGNPMKPKEGGAYDGSKPWMFWWNWVGMAVPGAAPAATPKPTSAPAPAERQVAREDPTRRSIERQTALIQAVAFAGHCMTAGQGLVVDAAWVLEQAQEFLCFLQPEAEPKAAMQGQEPTPEQAMQLRAGMLAKAHGLKPFGLMDWCQDPAHAALPKGTKWADATLEQKVRALDIFEAAHQEVKP